MLAPVRTTLAPPAACYCACWPALAAALAGLHILLLHAHLLLLRMPAYYCFACSYSHAAACLRLLCTLLLTCCCAPAPASHPSCCTPEPITAHVCGDCLCQHSLPSPTNENTCNMKHLLQNTSETCQTFRT
jgi:hypothetical protein